MRETTGTIVYGLIGLGSQGAPIARRMIDLLCASSGRSFELEVRGRMETPAGFRTD